MKIILENDILKVEVATLGAELQSVYHKADSREYLWDGKAEVWARRSPICFPNCGRILDDKIIVGGKEYPALPHGFIRDMEHEVVSSDEKTVTLCAKSNDFTKKYLPYDFSFYTIYTLTGGCVVCDQKIVNDGDVDMFFSIGFHTAIMCPFLPDTDCTDYYVEFEKLENCTRRYTEDPGYIIPGSEETYAPTEKTIALSNNIFSTSMLLEGVSSRYIDIKCNKTDAFVRIGGTDSPNTVIWTSPAGGLDLICIEPWHGKPDFLDSDHVFENKPGTEKLAPKAEFKCSQYIEIHA